MASRLTRRRRQQEREVVGLSGWPDLPPELLERIIADLSPLDRVAVRQVCPSWRACVLESFPSDFPFEVPRLLIRRPGSGGELASFSLHHRKIFPLELPALLRGGRCCGNIDGWLVMNFDSERTISICNHVSRLCVAFPPPPVFPVKKIVLSDPPSNPYWIAAVLGRTGTIALLQLDLSTSWMTIGIEDGQQHGGFRDIAFWRGRLCALAEDGSVFAFRADLGARTATVSMLREAERELGTSRGSRWQLYLLEMEGELLVVRKLYRSLGDGEVEWDVEVIILTSEEDCIWELVEEIPNHALFVGSVTSTAVRVALYPASGLRGSTVYFAQREVEMLTPHAICEYSMVDEEARGVPVPGGHAVDMEPVWITPFI